VKFRFGFFIGLSPSSGWRRLCGPCHPGAV